ncbi:MAG: diguanylate cyclase [Campylobacterota bacterium]|nr:diguanylate cyclase [Campylobacterota bacterium]
MKLKHTLLLAIIFLSINTFVYFITQKSLENTTNNILKSNINNIQTNYKILLESQKHISYAIHKSILRNTDVVKLLSKSYNQSEEIQAKNRLKLNSQLKEQYITAKKQGILQIHFVDRNNISFLRVHKPSKFGDDLTNIREDYKYISQTKKAIRGFVQGRVTHGFRNVFPIFDNGEYIGAMEVSFSSESLQWYLNNISNIHTHFLVKKNIFNTKLWERDDMAMKYVVSSESPNFMLHLNKTHTYKKCIEQNSIQLQYVKSEIYEKMKEDKEFALFTNHENHIYVVSFLPIKSISNETVAWVVSYTKSEVIQSVLQNKLIIRIVTFFMSILIIYFLIKQILARKEIKEEHKILENIINATDNILFITDFKNIIHSNQKFDNFFNFSNQYNILDIFIQDDNYLHKGLLRENESFISLFKRTKQKNRTVLILNKNLKPKAFKISISELETNYLITLTDVTIMRKELIKINHKAYKDGLTGVYNRNKFDELFENEIKRIKRYKEPLTIAIIDIDKFKDFNDSYGHLIGDEVLITMAHTVENNIRETDIFARWGGEEFVILFRNTKVDIGTIVANKIKDKIEENNHETAGKITASFGLTQYKENDTIESIFKRCDDALYMAKKNGRNRVEVL